MRFALRGVPTLLAGLALAVPQAAAAAPSSAATHFAVPSAKSAAHRSKAKARRGRGRQASCPSATGGARASHKIVCRQTARRTSAGKSPRSPGRSPASGEGGGESSAQAASIAQVLATPCQNTNLTPTAANLELVRAAILCLINTERAQHGELPLQADTRLEAAAESHGKEMLAANYFAHVSPSGVTPVDRVRQAGYIPSSEDGYVVGENLAWGTLSLSTPEAIVNAWIASPEHLANILEAKYRDTGIDVEPEVPKSLAEGVEGGLYTQEFGVLVH